MTRAGISFAFLNIGHFLDHLVMLVFASVAALALADRWGLTYSELIPYATPGFVAFGVFAIPAGWLADKWSREGMMAVFFLGIGAGALLAAMTDTPAGMAVALFLVGLFAAIYHPVGLAMVVEGRDKTGVPLAVNGVFGNLGVASAALISGFFIDVAGWRDAFAVPGVVAVATGLIYAGFVWWGRGRDVTAPAGSGAGGKTRVGAPAATGAMLVRIFAIVFASTAIGGLIFQSTTFALPKVLDERLADVAGTASLVGWYAFLVFAIAALAQLVVGYLVDNFSIRAVFGWVAALQVVGFAVMRELTGLSALVVAVGFMLVVFGQIPINDVLLGRVTRSEWRARAYAMRYVVTVSVMASAVPFIAWLHAEWGFSALFAVLAVAATLIFGCVILLPRVGAVTGVATAAD